MFFEISIKHCKKDLLCKLFADRSSKRDQLAELIDRFHPRSTTHPNTLFAKFSEDELDVILDALTDRFVSVGLREDSEPNTLGLMIEGLIDAFNVPMLE